MTRDDKSGKFGIEHRQANTESSFERLRTIQIIQYATRAAVSLPVW